MKKFTLRVPESAGGRLRRLSQKHGVTMRGWLEACTILTLDAENDPARRPMVLDLWAAARRLEASETYRQRPQARVNIELGDDLAAALAACCRRHGVSMNAALALTVMGIDDPAITAYVVDLHMITLSLARRLDRSRRCRKRLNPPLAVNT